MNGFYHSILSNIQCHYRVILSLLNERDRYLQMNIGGVEAFFYYKHLNTYHSQSSLASKQIPVLVRSMTKKILPTTYSIVGWKLNSTTPNIQSKEIDIYILQMNIGGVEAFFYYKHLNTYNSQSSLTSKQILFWVRSMTKKILPTTYSIVGWKLNSTTPLIYKRNKSNS